MDFMFGLITGIFGIVVALALFVVHVLKVNLGNFSIYILQSFRIRIRIRIYVITFATVTSIPTKLRTYLFKGGRWSSVTNGKMSWNFKKKTRV